jgi:hypothetical protein
MANTRDLGVDRKPAVTGCGPDFEELSLARYLAVSSTKSLRCGNCIVLDSRA